MGFNDVKQKVIGCLSKGLIFHEQRNKISIKNLLAIGQVSILQVIDILKASRGNNYSSSPHHYDTSIDVLVVTVHYSGKDWYIKWYFIEPNCIFISVHN